MPEVCIEECADGITLPEAYFERKQTFRNKCGMGLWNEQAIYPEAIGILFGTTEESKVGFVVADFRGEGGRVCESDVGRVRDDHVERFAVQRRQQVGLEEVNTIGDVMAHGIFAGNGKSGG